MRDEMQLLCRICGRSLQTWQESYSFADDLYDIKTKLRVMALESGGLFDVDEFLA